MKMTTRLSFLTKIWKRNHLMLFFISFLNQQSWALNIRDFWQETQLSFELLVQGNINDQICYRELKFFRACILSVSDALTELERKTIALLPSHVVPGAFLMRSFGEFTSLGQNKREFLNLIPFAWRQSQTPFKKASFNELVNFLKSSLSGENNSFITATIYNRFLQESIDAHTYITPARYYNETRLSNSSPSVSTTRGLFGFTARFKEGKIIVVKIIDVSPAFGKMRLGDEIRAINGQTGDKDFLWNLVRQSQQAHFELLNHDGVRTEFIARASFNVANVRGKILDHSPYSNGVKIGLITIDTFSSFSTCADFDRVARELLNANIDALIVDLRNNGGGSVREGTCIVDTFTERNAFSWRASYLDSSRAQENQLRNNRRPQLFHTMPSVVLINGHSASMSEAMALYLQAYGKSMVVGERSFGKGSMQGVAPAAWNPRVMEARTQALYFGPNGVSPQIHGVMPDIEVFSYFDQTQENEYQREADLYNNLIANNAEIPVDERLQQRNELIQNCLEEKEFLKAHNYSNRFYLQSADRQMITAQASLGCFKELNLRVLRTLNIPSIPVPSHINHL